MKKRILSLALLSTLTLGGFVTTSCKENNPTTVPVTSSVEWEGVEDITLSMGDATPNLLEGVVAKTTEGVTLTVKVDEESSDVIDTGAPGVYTIYYQAYDGDVAIDPEDTGYYARAVTVQRGSALDNSTFDVGVNGWNGNGNAGSVMSFAHDATEKALKVTIENSGQEYYQNQVEYNGLDLFKDTTYEISFKAKSSVAGRNIGASLEVPSLGYKCVEDGPNSVGLPLTTEYETYKFYYTSDEDYQGVKLGILLGRFTEADDTPATVWIDDVYVKKAAKQANSTGVTFEGDKNVTISSLADVTNAAKITATDKDGNDITSKLVRIGSLPTKEFPDTFSKASFGEMYTYTDDEGNLSYFRRQFTYSSTIQRENPWDAANQDLNGPKYWNFEENGNVDITANEDGTYHVKSLLTPPSNKPDYLAQIQQNGTGIKLKKGESYRMEVKAKINVLDVNTLRIEFDGDQHKTDMKFTKVNEYEVLQSDVYTPNEDRENIRIGLLLAEYNKAYEMTIDYIKIVKIN